MDKLIFSDKDHVSADVVGFEDEHVKMGLSNQNTGYDGLDREQWKITTTTLHYSTT